MKEVFEKYLEDISYDGWDFNVHMEEDRAYLQVGFWEVCVLNPQAGKAYQTGRKWLLSPYMTKSEVVQTAFKAVMTAVEHEMREKFSYKNKAIFGPHYNIDVLAGVCGEAALDVRPLKPQMQEAAA